MQMNFAGLSQVRRTIHSARREVLLAVPRGGPALDGEVDLTAARIVAGAPGVSVRVYLPPADPEDTALPRCELVGLAKQGVEVHTAPAQNPRMVIVDRSVVVLARNRTDYGDGALIGHGLPFTPMLVRMLTSAAQEDDHEPRPAEEPLTPLSREILRQLSRGPRTRRPPATWAWRCAPTAGRWPGSWTPSTRPAVSRPATPQRSATGCDLSRPGAPRASIPRTSGMNAHGQAPAVIEAHGIGKSYRTPGRLRLLPRRRAPAARPARRAMEDVSFRIASGRASRFSDSTAPASPRSSRPSAGSSGPTRGR